LVQAQNNLSSETTPQSTVRQFAICRNAYFHF
jgi:hypothetical protein